MSLAPLEELPSEKLRETFSLIPKGEYVMRTANRNYLQIKWRGCVMPAIISLCRGETSDLCLPWSSAHDVVEDMLKHLDESKSAAVRLEAAFTLAVLCKEEVLDRPQLTAIDHQIRSSGRTLALDEDESFEENVFRALRTICENLAAALDG